jgi:hypothetical protein
MNDLYKIAYDIIIDIAVNDKTIGYNKSQIAEMLSFDEFVETAVKNKDENTVKELMTLANKKLRKQKLNKICLK